jgi:kumamolisin
MADRLVSLKGSVPVNNQQLIGAVNSAERIEVTVKIRRKSEEGLPTLDEFVAGERARGITRQILADRYGAAQQDVAAVRNWALKNKLSVARVDLATRQVHLVGSAGAMQQAFGVKLSVYEHARTKTRFRCPQHEIQIPESLTPIITGVFGLNDMPVVVRHSARVGRRAAASADPKDQFPGSFYPNEVAKLYNFPPTQGAGQRVAILEFGGGFDQAVLNDYFTNNIGLANPPTVNGISVLNTKIQVDPDVTGEVYLDIEVIGATAPQATMDVFFAPWTGEGYLNAIEQAIHNDDYAAISISYGLDEDLLGASDNPAWPMLNQAVDEALRDGTAIGVPIFVSTGDQGSSSLRGQTQDGEITVYSATAHAGYPATSPYATAVGGTQLYAANGAISQEVVWNELGQVLEGEFQSGQTNKMQKGKYYLGGATGGGVSDRYKTVPSYQTSAGINLLSANTPPAAGRMVPDVASNAGSSTGYLVSQPPGSPLSIAPVGGTSASAPMWTGLMACVREALGTTFNGQVPVFFFNDFAYAKGTTAAFRDVVGGRSFSYDGNGSPVAGDFTPVGNNRSTGADGYSAQKGYDLCTGWGTPNGVELLSQLEAWLQAQKAIAAPNVSAALSLQAAEKAASSTKPAQCTSCQATTAVDLKLTVSPPKNAVVSSLPAADFIAITWTQPETEAAAQVFGKGQYKFLGADNNNFTPLFFPGLTKPEGEQYHGHFMQVTVNGKTLICLKSEFHPKVQPSETTLFFERLVGSSSKPNFRCLITSGTSGGIWSSLDLGDVVVTNSARFGLTMTVEQRAISFTGLSDILGTNAPAGFATWYDYVNANILATDSCLNSGLSAPGGRAASGKPSIYYKAPGGGLTDVVTNSRITDDECGRISTYRTLGATLDENDAYVASALKAVGFQNWVSIRNVSDLPCAASSDDQYDRFGQCSSICGAYAIWAFIMGQ